jgi:hypothetical protein
MNNTTREEILNIIANLDKIKETLESILENDDGVINTARYWLLRSLDRSTNELESLSLILLKEIQKEKRRENEQGKA